MKSLIVEKIIIKMATDNIMNFLSKLDQNKKIGSITRKEIKKLVEDNLEEIMRKSGM